MKKIFLISFYMIIVIFIFTFAFNLNINFIDNSSGFVECVGNKQLVLLEECKECINVPHTNLKAIVEKIDDDVIIFKISDYGKTYLKTETISVKNNDKYNLNIGEKVFLKFIFLSIKEDIIEYENLEIYKKVDISDYLKNAKNDSFLYYKNEILYKINGKSFKYNDYYYFCIDGVKLDESYENIINKTLLIEEYKSIFSIWYNTLNSQETIFQIIIEDYIGEK